jgi:hypothetical protein
MSHCICIFDVISSDAEGLRLAWFKLFDFFVLTLKCKLKKFDFFSSASSPSITFVEFSKYLFEASYIVKYTNVSI